MQLAGTRVAGKRVAHARRVIRGIAAGADGVQSPGLAGQVVVAGAIGGFGVVGGRAEQTAKPVAAALADTVTFHGGRGFTCSRARAGR